MNLSPAQLQALQSSGMSPQQLALLQQQNAMYRGQGGVGMQPQAGYPAAPPAYAPTPAPAAQVFSAPPPPPSSPPPAAPEHYDQPQPQAYGQPQPQAYGQPQPQYGQPQPQAYGQPQPQAYGQHQPQAYGQPQPQAYGQPQGQIYGQPVGQAMYGGQPVMMMMAVPFPDLPPLICPVDYGPNYYMGQVNVWPPYRADFSDSSRLGYCPQRREFILNGPETSRARKNMSIPGCPVRPLETLGYTGNLAEEEAVETAHRMAELARQREEERQAKLRFIPMTGNMTKLGWNKTMLGGESWQLRTFALVPDMLSYSKPDGSNRQDIALDSDCKVRVVHASEPAMKNRHKGGEQMSTTQLLRDPMSAARQTSDPIGFNNCVELICPNYLYEGRTFYMRCSTLAEANSWVEHIAAAISLAENAEEEEGAGETASEMLKLPGMSRSPFAGFAAGLVSSMDADGSIGAALKSSRNKGDIKNPKKCFRYIKETLGTSASDEELVAKLSAFFEALEADGIIPRSDGY